MRYPISLVIPLLALVGSAIAGPMLQVGLHPNLDTQFQSSLPFNLASDLARQFPQSSFVYQPPLVGYFSPNNPAEWVIWTSLVPAGPNPFMMAWLDASIAPCANDRCVMAGSWRPGGTSSGGPGEGNVVGPGIGTGGAPIDPGAAGPGTGGPGTGGPGTGGPGTGGGPGGGSGTAGVPSDPGAAGKVPEPSTMGLAGIAALALVAMKRRAV